MVENIQIHINLKTRVVHEIALRQTSDVLLVHIRFNEISISEC